MCRRHALINLILFVGGLTFGNAESAESIVVNGGFENGLAPPWGTGLYSQGRPGWWNSSNCNSTAEVDERVAMEGIVSLYIANSSPRAAQVYGTTAQRIRIEPKRPYRITIWARGLELGSNGAVSVVVDDAWQVRPIALPKGSFAWTRLSGTFSLSADHADIRILSEDIGEAWIDDVRVEPLDTLIQ